MPNMIPIGKTSFSEIKASINEFLDANSNKYPITDSYEGSVRTMLVDLLAGFSTFLQYKFMMYRNESFMETAINTSSILTLAVNRYGYNFNRPTAPVIALKNTGSTQFDVCTGDIFGSVKMYGDDMDLVYMGEDKVIYPMQSIDVLVGVKNITSGNFLDHNFNNTISIDLKLDSYYVDNFATQLRINNTEATISRDPEQYIIENNAVDLSVYFNIAKIHIYEAENNFGVEVVPNDTYDITFVGTGGYEPDLLSVINDEIKLNTDWFFEEIKSYGTSGDSIAKIKSLAPLYYTSFRVMSNELSHRVIAMGYPGVIDIYVQKSVDNCCEVDFFCLFEGSNDTPRLLTDYEKQIYVNYLTKYKYLGMALTTDNVIEATVKNIELMIEVVYVCAYAPEGFEIVESIEDFITDIIEEESLILGATFKIAEFTSQVAKYTINGRKAIKSVVVYEDTGVESLPTYVPLDATRTFTTGSTEYLWIAPTYEIHCN